MPPATAEAQAPPSVLVVDADQERRGHMWGDPGCTVDLLLTDMILPDVHGGELAGMALQLGPGLRVVYTSGYAGDAVAREGMPAGHRFLAKPYGIDDLTRAVDAAFE